MRAASRGLPPCPALPRRGGAVPVSPGTASLAEGAGTICRNRGGSKAHALHSDVLTLAITSPLTSRR